MSQVTKFIEESIVNRLGHLSRRGALVVKTGRYTGRAVKERYVVERPETKEQIKWGKSNQPISFEFSNEVFQKLERKLSTSKSHVFLGNIAGHHLEIISNSPWHIAFCENMFRGGEIPHFLKGLSYYKKIAILHDPWSKVSELGISFSSETLIILDPVDMRIAIIGTGYSGEIKKSAFSICNYSLPDFEILPLHASANCLPDGTGTCLLFGLSATGKTTLSASPDRLLIGDDEIIWTKHGVSNLESGCYAKLIDLTEDREPEIFRAANRFGAILENVSLNEESREIDFTSRQITENTRGSYSLSSFERSFRQDMEAESPKNIVFLTADALGALPAVAKLDLWQAQYHFLSGYTSKVAGTEMGVHHPSTVFSHCFGEPFMPRYSSVYSRLLEKFAKEHHTDIWLLNTGWTHGGYGHGERYPLQTTRRILSRIQSGALRNEPMIAHPVFGFMVPTACEGVDSNVLRIPFGPQVDDLAFQFTKNASRFSGEVDPDVIERGGPRIASVKPTRVEEVKAA